MILKYRLSIKLGLYIFLKDTLFCNKSYFSVMQDYDKFCDECGQLLLLPFHLSEIHSPCCTHLAQPTGIITPLCSAEDWRWDKFELRFTELLVQTIPAPQGQIFLAQKPMPGSSSSPKPPAGHPVLCSKSSH